MNLLVPGLLLLAASMARATGSGGGPKPTPPPGASTLLRGRTLRTPRVATPAAKVVQVVKASDVIKAVKKKRAAAEKPKPVAPPVVQIEHPDVIPANRAPEQAAVDATMTQVVREDAAKQQAAKDLLKFLLRTGRFGTLKDRPAEVKAAQLALGVQPDGIVGPRTRAAARKQGVALPPVK